MSAVFKHPPGGGNHVFLFGKSSAINAGDLEIGDVIYIRATINNVNSRHPFVVVHQGKPSNLYDDSCAGAWLLSQNAFPVQTTYISANYSTSGVASAFEELESAFDRSAAAGMKEVKIPYTYYDAQLGILINSGANGYPCKIFAPAANELGYTTIDADNDGAKLEYFDEVTNTQPQAIASISGIPVSWWTRTGHLSGVGNKAAYRVTASGLCTPVDSGSNYIRPMFVFDPMYKIRKSWFNA
jgi:hypothetical protein